MGISSSDLKKHYKYSTYKIEDILDYLKDGDKIFFNNNKPIENYYDFLSNRDYGWKWLATNAKDKFLNTRNGKLFLSSNGGYEWLSSEDGYKWLTTQSGNDWLSQKYVIKERKDYNHYNNNMIGCGEIWLETKSGYDWLQTPDGNKWILQNQKNIKNTKYGSTWLTTNSGYEWLKTNDGKKFLATLEGFGWLTYNIYYNQYNSRKFYYILDLMFNNQKYYLYLYYSEVGVKYFSHPVLYLWISENNLFLSQTNYLDTYIGKKFMETQYAHSWLSSKEGYKWLENETGMKWLKTDVGKIWLKTNIDSVNWINNEGYEWLNSLKFISLLNNEKFAVELFASTNGNKFFSHEICSKWIFDNQWFLDSSEFLISDLGRNWLESIYGKKWLSTSHGSRWLSGLNGNNWLCSVNGQEWLKSEDGNEWISKPDGFKFLLGKGGIKFIESNMNWLLHSKNGKRFKRYIENCAEKDINFMTTLFAQVIYERGLEDYFFPKSTGIQQLVTNASIPVAEIVVGHE